ncbi:MAG: ERCC4 domain-containing protein [Planctomycetia bacterium]|nr:ERCC4 domain-containing protein [Planctomycetia bacterium]
MSIIPAEIPQSSILVIQDSREQNPFDLEPLNFVVGTLSTGDYSIRGLEHVVAIERKSLDDMIACVGIERERFDREVQRLLAYPVRCLIVEATWQDIENGGWRSRVSPQVALGSLLGWVAAGLPVVMAGDHERGGKFAARILFTAAKRRWREARALLSGTEALV